MGTPAATTFNDTGLTNGTSYSYRVRATDAAPNLSGYSSVATASTNDTAAPTAPTGLTATPISGTQINLSWTASTDNVGGTGYQVERCPGAGWSKFTPGGKRRTPTFHDTRQKKPTHHIYP